LGAGREDVTRHRRDAGRHPAIGQCKPEIEGSEGRTMVKMSGCEDLPPRCEMPTTVEAVRAEALFVSTLQSSESPAPDQVRRAVATTMRRLDIASCAGQMAREFGEHPDTAAARMTWALATIRTVYPRSPATIPTHTQLPLALAS
jgi:hypothetical protein